jgi:hypothetical protein
MDMGGSRVLMHLSTISRHELKRLAKSGQLEGLLNGTSTNQERSSSRQIRRERRQMGRKKRGPRKTVNSGVNPGNRQMKGMWRLTLTNIRTTLTTAKAC